MHKILQSYLRRLTNISSNNRSLFLPRLVAKQHIDVHTFDYLNNLPSFNIVEWLIAGGKHEFEGINSEIFPICPVADSRNELSNQISQQLKRLLRTENFIYEEQGSKDLYVGWPFIQGKLNDGSLVRCPLMFFPVSLSQHKNQKYGHQWVLKIREEVAVSLNKNFLLAYAHYNELPLDERLTEKSFDEYDSDSRIFRTSLYQLIKESDVNINFNQEIFVDQLQAFKEGNKTSFESEFKDGELKLYPEAVLGIFPQAGSYLVPDYLKLIDHKILPDIESFFSKRSLTKTADLIGLKNVDEAIIEELQLEDIDYASRIKEEQIFCPFPMDAYQEKAIRAMKRGHSLLVQGPPGTGKSQLITNLIGDYIAHGKRVLVVCQKKAALDVVYQRLKEKDVDPFIALVHDFKNDRKHVYNQIGKQIDSLYDYQHKNNNLDTVYLERNFLQYSRQIEQITEELDEFKTVLFDESESGISAKELYLTSNINKPSVNVKQEYRKFNFLELTPFLDKLRTYTSYANRFDKESYLFSDRKPFLNYSVDDQKKLRKIVSDIPKFKKQIETEVSKVVQSNIDFVSCTNLQQRSEEINELSTLLAKGESFKYFKHMVSLIEKDADSLWLSNIERITLECFQAHGPEVTLSLEEIGSFQSILLQADSARRGPISWFWWKMFSKDQERVTKVFEANQLELDKKGFQVLSEKVDNRLNLEHNLSKLKEKSWLDNVPSQGNSDNYNIEQLRQWFVDQENALKATLIFKSLRNFSEYFNLKKIDYKGLKERTQRLITITSGIPIKINKWEEYLSPAQISKIVTHEHEQEYLKTLNQDFDSICHYDTINDELKDYEKSVINRLLDECSDCSVDGIVDLFQNSLRLAWIDHLEVKHPVLRIVSSDRMNDLENQLQQAINSKGDIMQEILHLKLRERTYYDVEYNRLNNMVTYRDLKHQISKQRKVWPLRKLISTFDKELFNLVPCWLASPETVSAVFPLEDKPTFDLVIFDEASQCFAEKAIPAMYRGQQVLVTGDSQQLSPNDLYQARWEDEENDHTKDAIAIEANSILDLASNYLQSMSLQSHYRSKSLELIDFSNQNFYENRLRLLPDFSNINSEDPAISYIKVDGEWENQTNQVESNKVIQLVQKYLKESPEKSIGVITFNLKQKELIQDELEKASLEKNFQIPSQLFIKNIENVQGDERDIIIFSIAYAPDSGGKLKHQFGSLNQVNGHNRLNVAVTRAKEKIDLITSIMPQQLNVDATKHDGPKLLKKYLEYAHQVSESNYCPEPLPYGKHATDWFLGAKLAEWSENNIEGYSAERVFPFADLTVSKENGQYVGLVNTDDDLYFQSESAKDMHAYRHMHLASKNWKVKYIYSRQYWQSQESTEEALNRFIKTDGDKS